MGEQMKQWIEGFHYDGKPYYTEKIEDAMVWTEEAACQFTMEAADEGNLNYWPSPIQVSVKFESL